MNEEVSIIVINRDGLEHLETCFTSLKETVGEGIELVLLDNASSDGSVEYVRSHFPSVSVIENAENQGFAGGYDRAIRDSRARWVVLLNNDTEVSSGWLDELLLAAQGENVAAVGARLMGFADRTVVDHAGGKITVGGGGIDLDKGEKTLPKTAEPYPTGFGCGACLMVRRDLFVKLGGFDSRYVIYHEDVDFCWKAWIAGYRVLHVPKAIVFHKGGATMGEHENPNRVFLGQHNRLANLIANAELLGVIQGLFVSAVFDVVRFLKWFFTLKWRHIWAMKRAELAVLFELEHLLRRRGFVQSFRVRGDRDLKQMGLMAGAWEAFRSYLRR